MWLFKSSFLTQEDGFSLVEMAVVLAILGVVTTLSLPLLTRLLEERRHGQTTEHQRMIFHALGAYALRKGQLPCPSQDQGGRSPNSCLGQTVGFVPYGTLGLPEAVARDGYGQWMIYGAHPQLLGDHQAFCKHGDRLLNQSKLQVLNESGVSVVEDGAGASPMAAVLVAPQQSAQGAASALEQVNLAHTKVFHDQPFSQNPQRLFRQKLLWATRDVLAGVYGHGTCPKEALDQASQGEGERAHSADPPSPFDDFLDE
jgi:prepilin-type N-terminal cleavage/methylation domain-containing protein